MQAASEALRDFTGVPTSTGTTMQAASEALRDFTGVPTSTTKMTPAQWLRTTSIVSYISPYL